MYKIIGIKNVNYVSKAGRQVTGCNIFVVYEDKHVEGFACDNFYISQSALDECGIEMLQPDDYIEVFYNKFGKIASLRKLDIKDAEK